MAVTEIKHDAGFLEYGSNDPDVIGFASLTSSDDIDIGVHSPTITEGDGVTYTEDGVQIGSTQNGLAKFSYPNALALLLDGGHITFWVEKEFFAIDAAEALNALLFSIGGTNTAHLRKQFDSFQLQIGNSGTRPEKGSLGNAGSGSHIRVDANFLNMGMQIFVDELEAIFAPWGAKPAFNSDFTLSGNGDGLPNTQYRFKWLQMSTRAIFLPETAEANVVAWISYSFGRLGNYPLNNLANLGWQTDDYGDGTLQANDIFKDRGMIPHCHRILAQNNVFVGGNRIHWYGRGGVQADSGSSNPLSERTTALFSQAGGAEFPTPGLRNTPNVLVSNIGNNDISAAVSDATFQTSYDAEIQAWIADLAPDTPILLLELSERYDADHTANIVGKNAIVNGFAATYPQVSIVKVYQATVDDPDLIGDDGIHPSETGHPFYGTQIANKIIEVI